MISWSPPLNNGNSPVLYYVLEVRQLDYEEWEVVADDVVSSAHVVDDLLPGMTYVFRVTAVNGLGASAYSRPSPPVFLSTEEGK